MELEPKHGQRTEMHSGECSVIAFYGTHLNPEKLNGLYHEFVHWFTLLDHPVQKMSIKGVAWKKKLGAFSVRSREIVQSGFADVIGFSMYSLVPSGDTPLWDWCVTCEVVSQEPCVLFGCRSSIAGLADSQLRSMAEFVLSATDAHYGIGFRRDIAKGPTLYAVGIAQGLNPWGTELLEVKSVSQWEKYGLPSRCFDLGFIRDIYPLNYLNHKQMSRMVFKVPLIDWIRADSERGKVERIADGLSLWTVPDANIESVRAALTGSGLLFRTVE